MNQDDPYSDIFEKYKGKYDDGKPKKDRLGNAVLWSFAGTLVAVVIAGLGWNDPVLGKVLVIPVAIFGLICAVFFLFRIWELLRDLGGLFK